MRRIFLVAITVFLSLSVKADQGLWIPSLIGKYNIEDMKKAGFKLTAEDIYNINNACIKDAILGISTSSNPFAFTGSASFISARGLVITNQHTVVRAVSKVSDKSNDYIKDGFWASDLASEIKLEGFMLSRLVRIENVTKKIFEGITKDTPARKINSLINRNAKILSAEATMHNDYKTIVRPYFSGNQYFMEVYEQYKDVRLAGLPPKELAKLGGDVDNWSWPRYSFDFSLLRVYGADKKPLKPHFNLKISEKSVESDDFVFIMGFPGSTKQYVTSEAIKQYESITNFHKIKIYRSIINTLNKYTKKNKVSAIHYEPKLASLKNTLKKLECENIEFKATNLVEKKVEEEKMVISKYPEAKPIIDSINSVVKQLNNLEIANTYLLSTGINGADIIPFAAKFEKLHMMGVKYKSSKKKNDREIRRLRLFIKKYFKNFNYKAEREVFEKCIELYFKNTPEYYHSEDLKELASKYKYNFKKLVAKSFKKSLFTNQKRLEKFLDNYKNEDAKKLANDPIFRLSVGYYIVNAEKVARKRMTLRKKYGSYFKNLVYYKTRSGIKHGPDATRSLRLSYGKVKGLENQDDFKTTTEVIISKLNKRGSVYSLSEKSTEFLNSYPKDKPICIVANTHTTGGNSGSAVMNDSGELVGIYFDRNQNGVISDYGCFSPKGRSIAISAEAIFYYIKHNANDYLKNEIFR